MAVALVWLARCTLILTLIAAPWAIGGADLPLQRWLMFGVVVAGALGWCGAVLGGTARVSRVAAAALMLAAGFMAIGAVQLLPHSQMPALRQAQLTGLLDVLMGGDSPASARSLEPAATRLWMARLAVAISAFVSGAWLFGERGARHWLWAILGINSVAVVAFGLIQRSSWNGKLYWTIPLELGGQPFAAFVNRNNAAEYLSMCLAGVLGLWATNRMRGRSPATQRPPRNTQASLAERVPGAAWGVIILLLFGGVLATLSRAGTLSAVAGVVIAGIWAGAGRRTRNLLLPLLGIIVAAGVWIGVSNQAAPLRSRLASLGSNDSADGRLQHWSDMRAAVRDFPRWGTGFGTYRYANKPYESRRSESWFESADNQYLDLLVEGGMPATALAALIVLLAAWIAHRWKRGDNRPEALASGYLLVAIGLQSITDCWFATAANLLTLSALAGSLSHPEAQASDAGLTPLAKVERLMESRRGRVPDLLIGLCALLAAGLGAYEVDTAARSTVFRRSLPDDEHRADWTPPQLDGLLAVGEDLAARRPDDAELHAALARLWFYRYRLTAASRLDVVGPVNWKDSARWERSGPQALMGTLARYTQIGDEASLQRFRNDPTVKENLEPMSRHVQLARRSCPILPHIGLLEAIDALLADGAPSVPLRREAALSPARVQLLHALAKSAEMVSDDELFAVSLARCIALDPARVIDYIETARRRLHEPQIVEQLLPQQPEPLLDFAEQAHSTAGKSLALSQAAALIEQVGREHADVSFLRGRLRWLQGDVQGAERELHRAVAERSLDPERRLLYARVLHAAGQIEGAREQLETARRLLPENRRFHARIRELESQFDAP